jgi:molecular chaperone DnaJ
MFRRDGEEILLELRLTYSQAALGADVDVPTIHGSEAISIPSGTQTGTRIKIRNKGVPRLNGGGKGDQIVFVTVVTPQKLNKEQRRLLKKLGEITPPPKIGERATGQEKSFFEKLFG